MSIQRNRICTFIFSKKRNRIRKKQFCKVFRKLLNLYLHLMRERSHCYQPTYHHFKDIYLPIYIPPFGSYPSNEVIKNFYISDITSRTFIFFFRFLFLVVVAVVVAQFGVIKKLCFICLEKSKILK